MTSLLIKNGYKGGEGRVATMVASEAPKVKGKGMEREDLSRRLRVLRAEKAWGLVEAAKIIGISPNTLTDAEHGRRLPSGPTLTKIAEGYGVPLASLFTDAPIRLEDRGGSLSVSVPDEASLDELLYAARAIKAEWRALLDYDRILHRTREQEESDRF